MSSPRLSALPVLWASLLALLSPASAAGQQPEGRPPTYDPLGLWPANVTGWNLPLASGTPPHHQLIFAQPASLELWGRPFRFGYYAGRHVERPLGQRFAFGEGREDIVWIGETRHALAQQVLSPRAESWAKTSAPRQPEAAWEVPLDGDAAWAEAEERLGRRAWGELLRDPKRGLESTKLAWARARGQHELLFASGALLARDPNAAATPNAAALELAGLLAALAHSHHPHEVLRGEIDARTRLGTDGSAQRLLAALLEGWTALAADRTPELDRGRQALAQLDRATPESLRAGARAAMQARCAGLVAADKEPQPFPSSFRLEHKRSAGNGLKIGQPMGIGVGLRFDGGRPKLERGRFGPWSERVSTDPRAEERGAFSIAGDGVLLIYFEDPKSLSSASLRLRHRLEAPEKAAAGILLTIDFNPVIGADATAPRGTSCAEQSFDVTEHIDLKSGPIHMLMLSLAPGAPSDARYWLAELELTIEA